MSPQRLHPREPGNGKIMVNSDRSDNNISTDDQEERTKLLPETRQEAQEPGPKKTRPCPFCNPRREYIVLANDLCYCRWDINPVSRGHLLIIPFRHVADFFDTTAEERYAIMDLAAGSCRTLLQERFHPSGYNFGVNVGEAAGQAIGHVHFHLIPRYYSDARSKPNGMRNVVPKITLVQHNLLEFQSP
jgi:diadenosine tetraphosphate (Ap4A) HIT family hydrolase